LNYQEKVCTRADVRALYEKVIANPAIQSYRGYTESKSYGWDTATDDYIKRDGEVWFENPAYDADFIPEGVCESDDTELLDEQLAEKEQQIIDLEDRVSDLEDENEMLEQSVAQAEARAKAAENERDEAKVALIELRRALSLVRELSDAK
jgi:cell shape-determining protein MreC